MPSARPLNTCRATGGRKRHRLWWAAAAISVFVVIGPLVDSDDDERPGNAAPDSGPSSIPGAPAIEPAAQASIDASPAPSPTSADTASHGTALGMLAELEIQGRAPKTGYDHEFFGWRNDTDRNEFLMILQ